LRVLNRFREQALAPGLQRARAAVTAVFLLNGVLFGSWAARIPALQDRLALGEGELGLALGAVAIGALVAMPVAGGVATRVGSARATRIGVAACCLVVAVVALAPSLGALVAATFLVGAANGWLDIAMNAQGTAVERRAGRLLLSSLHAAFSAGGLIGALTGALVAGAGVDARVHLALVGLAAAPLGVAATRHLLPDAAHAAEGSPAFARPSRALLALGVLALCGLLAEGAAADWSGVYLQDVLGASAGVAPLAFAAFSATMTLGRLLGDRLAAALGPVRLLRACGTVGAAGLGGALLVAHPAAALVGFAMLGAGLSVVVPLVFRAAAQAPGLPPGPALAAVSTMGYTGFLAGPPVIGALAEVTSLPTALGLVAVLTGATVVLAGTTRQGATAPAGEGRGAPAAAPA
jgi:MFS family permease